MSQVTAMTGDQLRNWCKKHEMTQRQLAERLGVGQNMISRIFNDQIKTGNPLWMRYALAGILLERDVINQLKAKTDQTKEPRDT
jgi:transcriptional regulator with XRE-family HTH domain